MGELGRLAVVTAMAVAAGVAMPAVVLPLAGPPGPVRVVFLAPPDPSALPDGVTIDVWGRSAVLGGVDAGAARALYAMGAIVVYPVRVHGCLALRPAPTGLQLRSAADGLLFSFQSRQIPVYRGRFRPVSPAFFVPPALVGGIG